MAKRKHPKSRSHKTIDEWLEGQPRQEGRRLRSSLNRLQGLYKNRPERDDFTWCHQVGTQVLAFFPEEESRYGENLIELLADHLQPGRLEKDKKVPNFLYQARDFARAYSDQAAATLADARNADGGALSIYHVIALSSVENTEQRLRFFDKCLDQCWSVRRLRQEIQNARGGKRGGGGRKRQRPERQTAGVAVRNISTMSRQWMDYHRVWFVGSTAAFSKVRRKDCDEAVLKYARSAIKELDKVHKATGEGLDQLKEYVQELEERLST
jgi:hypothetical protein